MESSSARGSPVWPRISSGTRTSRFREVAEICPGDRRKLPGVGRTRQDLAKIFPGNSLPRSQRSRRGAVFLDMDPLLSPGVDGPPSSAGAELGEPDLWPLLQRLLGGRWPPADRALRPQELPALASLDPEQLARRLDLTQAGGLRLAAAFELGRQVERARLGPRPLLDSPERAHAALAPFLRGRTRESVWVALLDGRNRLQRLERISEGTLTTSLVHPREVFGRAVRESAGALILAHNHPSGDPTPTAEDRQVTRRLHAVGEIVGVPLLDHLVISDAAFVSIKERYGIP